MEVWCSKGPTDFGKDGGSVLQRSNRLWDRWRCGALKVQQTLGKMEVWCTKGPTDFGTDGGVVLQRWCRKSTDGTEVECPDNNFEMAPSDCYVNTTCPEDCPDYYFGIECVSCLHCKDQCNKFNGTCQQCLPGYRDPDTGCQSVCMKNFYGKDCNGSCLSKCGSDCADRVTGECPSCKLYIKKSKHDQSSEQQTSVSGVKIFHIPPLVEISDIPPPEESYAIPPTVESSAIPTPSKTSISTPSKTSN
uniref:Uncharacterized protein n=1 Tax=Biomphalaria glabrata TaxID=6526 RepID=A0A2C9LVC0_BIOGL